ncbi:hypothetical protein [Actinoalloteichus hymeniacidonis]|uniref:Uncharacterized protein n=1 Tax=Actinoalloteichus hymeniacidonis TaxID=340345 RepID=A0AAC9HS58_9PSEU|nr:hypothetical protein [Actinoalloteichus hymeniacidonis]AOS64181.1 hypothetical protein TL08_16905 [Actinoalloteichus hymeniacidonis]MBB5907751.1 hypothetical protein [Actinoalloteichus hymeniacidonis]
MTEYAEQPCYIEQVTAPLVGLICDRHTVVVAVGAAIPTDGDRVETLCGQWMIIGPPPTEAVPGIPATHFADCADCHAIRTEEPENEQASAPLRFFVRLRGTVDVHIASADPTIAELLITQCGRRFRPGDDLELLDAGDGAPCVRCLLLSLSGSLRQVDAAASLAQSSTPLPHPAAAINPFWSVPIGVRVVPWARH